MNRNDLKRILKVDKKQNIRNESKLHYFLIKFSKNPEYLRWKFILFYRKSVYYFLKWNKRRSLYNFIMLAIFEKKKNKIGNILGYEIMSYQIGEGLTLFHNGPIVIGKSVIIGKFCSLHGSNCIGNNGLSDECPIIGDNADIGVGSIIIGNVTIANNCIIGANSLVNKSFLDEKSIIAGVPAKVIKCKKD